MGSFLRISDRIYNPRIGYMEPIWHGMIRLPYEDLIAVADLWSQHCQSFAIAEHEPDEEVEVRHCHMLMEHPDWKKNTFQKAMKDLGVNPGKGNHWIMDKVHGGDHKGEPYKRHELLMYLMKGEATRLKMSKNIPPAEIEAAAASWVEPKLGTSTPPATSKKQDKQEKKKDEITELAEGFLKKYDLNDEQFKCGFDHTTSEIILNKCRTFTMSYIYHKSGKLPFPGTYKQTAGTVYLKVIEKERPDLFEEALLQLKNIWY